MQTGKGMFEVGSHRATGDGYFNFSGDSCGHSRRDFIYAQPYLLLKGFNEFSEFNGSRYEYVYECGFGTGDGDGIESECLGAWGPVVYA